MHNSSQSINLKPGQTSGLFTRVRELKAFRNAALFTSKQLMKVSKGENSTLCLLKSIIHHSKNELRQLSQQFTNRGMMIGVFLS